VREELMGPVSAHTFYVRENNIPVINNATCRVTMQRMFQSYSRSSELDG